MAKSETSLTITPIGYAAQSVTGSCNIVQYNKIKFAVELGGIQEGHTPVANYNLNKKMLTAIKFKTLDYIFACHAHYDHIGMIPAAYSRGCAAKLIVPYGMTIILKEMWLDSAKIMQHDYETLLKKTGKEYTPFYSEKDIGIALEHIEEYESNTSFELVEGLSFKFLPAGHIMLSQQLELSVQCNNTIKRILFTSDLGNRITEDSRVFVEKFTPCKKANIVLGESTYGLRSKRNTQKDFQNDIAKIKTIIEQFCIDHNSRVLIPCFSLDRTPIMLWHLYTLFGKDENFTIPIIVDSPLAIRLLHHYQEILQIYDDRRYGLFKEMMSWKNIQLITEYTDSDAAIKSGGAKVVLAAGGMLQSGRSINWAQSIIPRANDCIAFCGYCGEGTLGWRIKHAKEQRTITINNKVLANRCQVVELLSFSSHCQHTDLVNYYSSIVADKIYLLHGSEKARLELKEDIQDSLTKMAKTTKVAVVNKSTVIKI